MKGLYFSDIHTYPYNEFSKPTSDGRTTLIVEHDRTYRWIADQIRNESPDFVVFLGDTAQTHGYLDAMSLTCIEYGYRDVKAACDSVKAQLYWMIGNHDLLNDASRIHVLPFIREIVSDVCVRDELMFIPFFRDTSEWYDPFQKLYNQCNIKRAFVHLDVLGGRYNSSNNICPAGIDPALFHQHTKAVAGHFHHPQSLTNNFFILGSCMYRNFSDDPVDIPRGIMIDRDGRQEVVENPHTSIYQTLKCEVDDPSAICSALSRVRYPDRTFLRFIYPRAQESEVSKWVKEFKGFKHVPIRDRKKNQVVVPDLPSAFDPHLVVDKYLQISPPASNVGSYKDYGHSIVNEVLGKVMKNTHRKVHILSTHIENFLSIAQMDVRFDETGVVYVDGVIEGREPDVSNGAGKSAMIEAPYWCLFGSLIRPKEKAKSKSVDSVVNNKSKSGCLVSNVLIVDDIEYQITRTRKHPQMGDDLRVYQEGNLVSQGVTASEKYIKDLVGIDGSTFKHVAMFADSLNTRFSSLGERERMELIESVIQLKLYDDLYAVIHSRLKTADMQRDATRVSIDRNTHVIAELTESLSSQSLSLADMESSIQATIAQKQKLVDDLLAEIVGIESSISSKKRVLEEFRESSKSVKGRYDQELAQAQQCSKTTAEISSRLSVLRHQLSDAESLNRGVCPTCKRQYDQRVDTSILTKEIEQLTSILTQWEEAHGRSVSAQNLVREELSGYQSNISLIENKISTLNEQHRQFTIQSKSLGHDISQLDAQLHTHRRNLSTLQSRIDTLKSQNVELEQQLKNQTDQADVIRYWDTGLSPSGGCRIWILNDALKQLSDIAVDYANLLSDGYAVPSLSIGSKNTIVLDVQTQSEDYSMSSSGERRVIDLSIQFAIARLATKYSGFSSNIMFLDEVEDKIDAAARRRLISLLNRIATEDKKIILIASQYKDLKSHVDRVWTVVKSNEISRLLTAA